MNAVRVVLLAVIFAIFSILIAVRVGAQGIEYSAAASTLTQLQNGVDLYARGSYSEALTELRRVLSETRSDAQRAETLYWIGITELSIGNNEAALRSIEALESSGVKNRRTEELPYHKGRILYNLGRYNESIVILGRFIESLPAEKGQDDHSYIFKSQSLYWIGECLFSMGQLDKAQEVFEFLTKEYPKSFKFEAAAYRLAIIEQKRIEAGLLDLLRWTHEESLRAIEEYRRREQTYEQALIAYQRRIAEGNSDSLLAELEKENNRFRQSLEASESRIQLLENELQKIQAASGSAEAATRAESRTSASRLSELRARALELMDEIKTSEGSP